MQANTVSTPAALIVGASQGIGLGFVEYLLANSLVTPIYATYRSPEAVAGLLVLREQYPERLRCIVMDITQEEQIAAVCRQIQVEGQPLQLVINCVGILHEGSVQPEKGLRQLDAEQLTQYFQVNSIGAVLLAKHLLPLLKGGDGLGHRNIFATISAKIGSIGDNRLGGWYGYRASKAALNMFLRTAAIEYRRRSPQTIMVMLHPGTTDTKLSQPFQRNVPPEKLFPVERTVTQLMAVINGLTPEDSGQFFAWDGSRLPW